MNSPKAIAVLVCLVVLLAAPGGASAATTCDYSGGLLDVQLPASADYALLVVSGTGEVEVYDRLGDQVACTGVGGPPSVSNTNVISVVNGANAGGNEVAIVGPSRFAPGASTVGENGGTPEIEISVNLNDRPGSSLTIGVDTLGVPIRFGTSGINTNATPEEVQPDADIFPTGVPGLLGLGDGTVASTLSAAGGAGTGGPLTDAIKLIGGAGADSLTGGTGPDDLLGGDGGDTLIGGDGADALDGYDGSDTVLGAGGNDRLEVYAAPGDGDSVDGGAGIDEAVVQDPAGVTVDLAIAGPQSPGSGGTVSLAGIENVTGTEFGDVLRGDGGRNELNGYAGDDTVEGRGGADVLYGGEGADSLDARDGGPDSADCGPDLDTISADLAGVETLAGCESVLFPVAPAGSGPGPGGRPGATAGRCGGRRATITGTNAGETIAGTRGRDVIDARGGNDRVRGLGGNDIVCGGRGRDHLDGGKGNDRLSGASGNDSLSGGSGKDRLEGDAGKDSLRGGSGRDLLLGGSGRDRLFGGRGRDLLRGGPGKDFQTQ